MHNMYSWAVALFCYWMKLWILCLKNWRYKVILFCYVHVLYEAAFYFYLSCDRNHSLILQYQKKIMYNYMFHIKQIQRTFYWLAITLQSVSVIDSYLYIIYINHFKNPMCCAQTFFLGFCMLQIKVFLLQENQRWVLNI